MKNNKYFIEIYPQLCAFLSYALVDTIFRLYANSHNIKSHNHNEYILFVGYLTAVSISLIVGIAILLVGSKRTVLNIILQIAVLIFNSVLLDLLALSSLVIFFNRLFHIE